MLFLTFQAVSFTFTTKDKILLGGLTISDETAVPSR